MDIVVNGEARDVSDGVTVGELVDELSPRGRRGVAVAVDATVVPRTDWDDTPLRDGSRVELLVAVQGG